MSRTAACVLLSLWCIHEGMEVPCCDTFGEGSGPIHIYSVTCVGSEENITDCSYLNDTVITSHQQDIGVQCQQGLSMHVDMQFIIFFLEVGDYCI